MVNIILQSKAQTPKLSHLYRKYDEITLDHCKSLLAHLYEGKVGSWVNPITSNIINNGSYITISFLSKCYYLWGNKIATINSKKLKYKKHIEKFIAKEYLFDISAIKQEPRRDVARAVRAVRAVKDAKTRRIRGGTLLKFLPNIRPIVERAMKTPYMTEYEFTEEHCKTLLNDIENKTRDKTSKDDLSNMHFDTTSLGENKMYYGSPKLIMYLSRCYYTFDGDIKRRIENLVDINELIDITPEDEKIRLAIIKIDEKLNKYIEMFNTFCDVLNDNCDANGILKDHIHISNIVNAILVIICTKYLHLYNNIHPNTYDKPLQIYMYDNIGYDIVYDNFKQNYNDKKIMYQKDDLMQTQQDTQINLKPKSIDKYKENTLLNRQYVFELSKIFKDTTIKYNMINNREDTFEKTFDGNKLPTTLGYAYELLFNKKPFNYNITNSILPKKINIECSNPSVLSHFDEILAKINAKLNTLPVIKDVRSTSDGYYNSVIFDMKFNGFGYNDMIRKNILYSLNAQDPSYIKKYNEATLGLKDFYKDKIYYNYGYTGTFPLFTWIPISSSEPNSAIYNFPSSSEWQPYGANKTNTDKFRVVETAYKNYYTQPFSKSLNETIYKVISGESTDVDKSMMKRIKETIGIYKDMDRAATYTNKKIYLYHGTNTKLHNMDGKINDIEIFGFLSTTLNVYVASFYSEAALMRSSGFIYIIEVDDTQTYINLNDILFQFILLPHSIIRILYEFDYMGIKMILCRLIKTPTKGQSNELYDKLLANAELAAAKVAVSYFIKQNNNIIPICAGLNKQENFKLKQKVKCNSDYFDAKITDEYMDIFQIPREYLMNDILPLDNDFKDNKLYVYFSLLQENELHIKKGEKTKGVYGGFDDIKYSIHQHFIKDCYKYLNIPCIDYIFLHGDNTTKNAIATGILLDKYENNRKDEYNYDINNLLIDCIFNFDSIDNNNKKLDLPGVDNSSEVSKVLYADKIEGFRNAGLYINGITNPLFHFDDDEQEKYILEYVKKYRNFLYKYSETSEENLKKHFECCNKKFTKLMGIIDHLKEQYLNFINDILQVNYVNDNSKNELAELNSMLNNLADTLRMRALFQFLLTRTTHVADFIKKIIKALEPTSDYTSDYIANDIPLPKNAKFADLILCEEDKKTSGGFRKTKVVGDYLNQIIPKYDIPEQVKEQGMRKSSSAKREIANKEINASISEYKSMYKFKDLPKDFQKYYGKQNKDKDIDISNGCHIRLVPREDTRIMGKKTKAKRKTI